jgi:hypothetical protein
MAVKHSQRRLNILVNQCRAANRCASTLNRIQKAKNGKIIDESSIAGAQHKASMSGPSLGYLISELSAARPGMESLRQEGQTMLEEHRTQARRVVKWLAGLPLAFGALVYILNGMGS